MKMNNNVYDKLKFTALIVLPAIATLYASLAGIWDLAFAKEIPATIMALDTALGAILQISTNQYKKELDK